MKKKILAMLVAICAVIPCVVSAADYSAGDYINFFKNDQDKAAYYDGDEGVGMATVYIGASDKVDDAGNKYLKVITMYTGTDMDKVKEQLDTFATAPYIYQEGGHAVVATATSAEGKLAFGETITINEATEAWLSLLTGGPMTAKDGGSLRNGDQYLVATDGAIKVTKANGVVTAASWVTEVPSTVAEIDKWPMVVVLMNEAYTCSDDVQTENACYECPSESDPKVTVYTWKKKGTQAEACKEVTTITSKAKCVKNSKTGVDNYLIPAAVVLGVCAIVLTVVKRKDAFKAI